MNPKATTTKSRDELVVAFQEWLEEKGACPPARSFARGKTAQEAYEKVLSEYSLTLFDRWLWIQYFRLYLRLAYKCPCPGCFLPRTRAAIKANFPFPLRAARKAGIA